MYNWAISYGYGITYLNDAWNAQPSGTLFNRSVVAAYSHVADMLRTLASCI